VFHVGDPANLAKQRARRPGIDGGRFAVLAASAAVVLVLLGAAYLGYRMLFTERPGSVFADRLSSGAAGPEMVVLPGGKFFMGNLSRNPVGNINEQPVHEVEIKSFALGRREVSFAEFDLFCDATGRPRPNDNGAGRGLNPVFNLSWDEALAYTEWLSGQTGQRYRLPTEAEWEYAARAGTSTEFAWGNEPSREYANYGADDCCQGLAQGADRWVGPAPVGSFPPNAFSLYDMAGNVYEWTCSNYHEPYSGKEQTCAEARDDLPKVFRGGSWYTSPKFMRPATRLSTKPTDKQNYLGFRVARDL
jgi:formylglycine-generating enzyme required for sulfatase activity